MRERKIRGYKRQCINMLNRIEENTFEFPTEFYNGYWHMLLPVSQHFINSAQTPKKIKRLCIQTLLDRAKYLSGLKPDDKEKYRIVVKIDLPDLWRSQIIVFKGDSYFENFFDRNGEYHKWLLLTEDRNIQTEWGLSIPSDFGISGYKEVINDEDYHYEGEIWFIGEL